MRQSGGYARADLYRALGLAVLTAGLAATLMGPVVAGPLTLVAPGAGTAGVSEISIPNTRRIEFVSKVNGHRYSISVAFPLEPAPADGYGVLYVLDGYSYFASATEAVRLFNAPGVMVVGIGYPHDPGFLKSVLARRGPMPPELQGMAPARAAPQLERMYDLSLPASESQLAADRVPGEFWKSKNVGGLDDFLNIIETEVKPRVASLAPINRAKQALFGHSLGGLAALHALFIEPNAFQTFIIASPSIWWNHKAVLADEAAFSAAVTAGRAAPRILVTIGAEESTLPADIPASWGMDRAALAAALVKYRMVDNGRELVMRLRALHGNAGFVVEDYAVFDKMGHGLAPWPALARGIAFAFPTTQ